MPPHHTATNASGEGGNASLITVVILASVMSVLDVTVVNVALNRLSQHFAAPLATIQWAATGYTLALASVIPLAAWAMNRMGAKRTYLTAIAMFVLGSALTGTAWNAESLIAFRVVQGLGGGLLMPVGMAMVIHASDKERLGRTMSLLGIPILIGPTIGPILGGWLLDELSWRWIFYINVPIGLAALALGSRVLRPQPSQPAHRLDIPGLLLLSPGLALLIYGLATGSEGRDFGTPGALLPLLFGAAGVLGFVVRALTARHPLVDLRVFRHRQFAVAAFVQLFFVTGYFGSMLLLPMYFQVVRGESASMSGLLGAPLALAAGVAMQFAGRLIDRIGAGWIVLAGALLAASGLSGVALRISADGGYAPLMVALLVMGTGVGMTLMPTMTAATRALPEATVPVGSTTLNINSQLLTSVGTALMSLMLANQLPGNGSPAAAARTVPPARLADAFQHTYWLAVALLAAAALPALWLSRRRPAAESGSEAPARDTEAVEEILEPELETIHPDRAR